MKVVTLLKFLRVGTKFQIVYYRYGKINVTKEILIRGKFDHKKRLYSVRSDQYPGIEYYKGNIPVFIIKN